MLQYVHHVHYVVRNLKEMIDYLEKNFGIKPAEVERAEKMIAAYDDAYAKGLGAVQFEGAMIDVPVVNRARTVVNTGVAYQWRPGVSFSLDVQNLFNEPQRYYRGVHDQVNQVRLQGTTLTLSLEGRL